MVNVKAGRPCVPPVADDQGKRRERVIFPMSYYSENKDAVKAPFKELGLTWRYLGQDKGDTKGRYTGDDVSVFVLYSSEHADFTVEGTDPEAIETILAAWEDMPTLAPEDEEAPESPMDEALAKEVQVWRFKEPARRPGEPESLYRKRLEDWKAKDPRT